MRPIVVWLYFGGNNMEKKFEELTLQKKQLLVGRIAKMYDNDNDVTVQEIADNLNVPSSWVIDILGIILVARDPEKYS